MISTAEGGIDTFAHAVGRAHKRGNFVPSLCARPARACRAVLSVDTETNADHITSIRARKRGSGFTVNPCAHLQVPVAHEGVKNKRFAAKKVSY